MDLNINQTYFEQKHASLIAKGHTLDKASFEVINAYLAGNNLMNSRANSVSVGLGVSFVDNDLKNLLGTAAAAAGN